MIERLQFITSLTRSHNQKGGGRIKFTDKWNKDSQLIVDIHSMFALQDPTRHLSSQWVVGQKPTFTKYMFVLFIAKWVSSHSEG